MMRLGTEREHGACRGPLLFDMNFDTELTLDVTDAALCLVWLYWERDSDPAPVVVLLSHRGTVRTSGRAVAAGHFQDSTCTATVHAAADWWSWSWSRCTSDSCSSSS